MRHVGEDYKKAREPFENDASGMLVIFVGRQELNYCEYVNTGSVLET